MRLKAIVIIVLSLIFTAASLLAQPKVRLETSEGDIVIKLYSDAAPITCANFLRYVREGRFDQTVFHRVVKDFVLQGGGYKIENGTVTAIETLGNVKSEADNGLYNVKGTLAMARVGEDADSATSQFFINLQSNTHLNYQGEGTLGRAYTVFGKVVSGWDVVQKIEQTPVTTLGPFTHWPSTPVVLEKAVLIEEEDNGE